MKDIKQLPQREYFYCEFEDTIKEAAINLYGLTLQDLGRKDLTKVEPGSDLQDLADSIGSRKLAHIVASRDNDALDLKNVTLNTNVATLIAKAFQCLVYDGNFAEFHLPDNHVPAGFKQCAEPPVQSDELNIHLSNESLA